MGDWIDSTNRLPKDGETIILPDVKGKFRVHGSALYYKGKLAIPINIIEKYQTTNELQ